MRPSHARPGRSRTRSLALVAGLSAVLVPHTAHASTGDDAPVAVDGPDAGAPQPYGGQLGHDAAPDGPDDVGGLGLLAFGAINAVGMVAGGATDALRGPSPEQTRRAMASRTAPGTVSERPRGDRRAGAVRATPTAPRPRATGAHRRGRHLRAVGPA
ncbi:hypothetical protein ACQPX6_23005 [Actinomycetospora sp. CA-101289]|uniref:hypothetical protein n=1 Tax=Actinomycetospora sp. CA-101289 TaxID=3239893 RepID=UPI003D95DE11